jgi:L-serine dehydratase
MYSIRELYRIGRGPSSSHTMGPANAASLFRQRFPQAQAFRIHLFGSLAATGRGHLTDIAVRRSLAPLGVSFLWQPEYIPVFHPNGMQMEALDSAGHVIGDWEVFSIGGGALSESTATGWLPQS